MAPFFAATAKATDLVWVGGTGNWDVAGNWSPAQVPGAADNVFINNAGDYTVSLPDAVNATVGSLTLGGATGTQILTLGRSILTLNGVSVVNSNGQLTMTVNNSTVTGTGALTVDGTLNWAGGTMSGAAVTTITTNGTVNITGNATLTARTLNNAGFVNWTAGNITAGTGAVINNEAGATFDNGFDGRINMATAPANFNNSGLFRKSGGSAALGTTSIDPQFNNSGTVNVQTNTVRYAVNQQTAGLTLLEGGGLDVQGQPLNFMGGSLVGFGPITLANNQNLINSASISPGLPIGQLDVKGNYQQTPDGVLNIDIGGYTPGTGFDLITVTAGGAGGVVSLGGTLNVALTNNFFPTNGATFTFLTAVSRGGIFSAFNYPSNDLGMQVIYDPASVTLKVTNLKPVVANPIADPPAVGYGDVFSFQFPANTFSDPDNNLLTYTASGLPPGITFVGATRTFSGTPTAAGVYPVSVIADDGGSPSLKVTNMLSITVMPATLTITADAKTKSYGASDPTLTFAVSGFKFTDTAETVLTGSLARTSGDGADGSPYSITQGTLVANASYTISFTGSALTITPASLSVTADAKTKTYGSTDPTFTASYAGFVNNETAAVLSGTLTLSRAPGEGVGNYAITPSGLTSGNYAITFNAGTLSIGQASLSVTADAKTKTYGATDPTFTASYIGFVNNETAAVLSGTLTLSRAPGEGVGSYAITPSGLTSGNYAITFNAGTLSIGQASLSVTANAKTKTYGSTDPTFTASYAGFVNNETAAVLSGTLTLSRAPGEGVGSYAITPSGLTSANYAITFNAGTLSIGQASLSVTADAMTKTYGSTDPTFTASYAGFVNNETVSVLGGTLTFTRAPGEGVGSYAITPSGLTSGNYAITFNAGTLSIGQASLSVTADAKTKTYGSTDPTFTASYAGFVNNETAAVLSGTLTLSRAPGEGVGSYAITPSGLTSANYNITFNTGTFTITAPLLVNLSIKKAGPTQVVVTWNSVSNANYRVQYKSNMSAISWTDLVGDILADGVTASKTDDLTTTNRFYQVQLLP